MTYSEIAAVKGESALYPKAAQAKAGAQALNRAVENGMATREDVDAANAEAEAILKAEKATRVIAKATAEPIGKLSYKERKEKAKQAVKEANDYWKQHDVRSFKDLHEILKKAKMPQKAIDAVMAEFSSIGELGTVIFAEAKTRLTQILNIGEKRAELILELLANRIPEPLAIRKLGAEVREQLKADAKEACIGFTLPSFQKESVWPSWIIEKANFLAGFSKLDEEKREEKLFEYRKVLKEIEAFLNKDEPLIINRKEAHIVRLNRTATSEILDINYESKIPTNKLCIIEHGTQEIFRLNWRLFSNVQKDGEKATEQWLDNATIAIGRKGIVVKDSDNVQFELIASSASHQKKEAFLACRSNLVAKHADFFYRGRTKKEYVREVAISGQQVLKESANLIRPLMKRFITEDGKFLKVRKILVVKDTEKVLQILNARLFGGASVWENGSFPAKRTIGDGAILSLRRLMFQGQCSGLLIKGMLVDATSAIEAVCRKHGITVEEFMNTKIMGIDGKMHRLGDYDAIMGDGCWKGSKSFKSYEAYLDWVDNIADKKEGLDCLWLLRQAEEVEDLEKVRRLTSSLIQQFMFMTPEEQRELTLKARNNLKKAKTFIGCVRKLAALGKDPEERTILERLFLACPWLVMSPVIQQYLREQWERKLLEAKAGKFRTEGQYPYIMEDPVALLEVWVLGKSPDDPDLGILKAGEVSCADVPDGRKLLVIRFPANFLTAEVRVNRACRKEFASLNGVMVLSIHDVILIRQDGDVDGDEACVIYNRLSIKLIERMHRMFNPPVVLFKHGDANKPQPAGSEDAFRDSMYKALANAKRFDSVGEYANLAADCGYLAAVALKRGNMDACRKWLEYMSAASTGAIISIDQVKGNAVDEELVKKLKAIKHEVRKELKQIALDLGADSSTAKKMLHPRQHYYRALAKRAECRLEEVLPTNTANFMEEMTELITHDVGTWDEFDAQGVIFNKEEARRALLNNDIAPSRIKIGVITQEMVDLLDGNWHKMNHVVSEKETNDSLLQGRKKFVVGAEIGFKEFILILWRNEAAMASCMEGRNLWEQKEAYHQVCRDMISKFLRSNEAKWIKDDGTKIPFAERCEIVVNNMVCDALELTWSDRYQKYLDNRVASKGNYAMFVLKVFAKAILRNALKNGVNIVAFFGENAEVDFDVESWDNPEKYEDEEELFESTSQSDCEGEYPPPLTDEELTAMEAAIEYDDEYAG